jgi:hypothetical protein
MRDFISGRLKTSGFDFAACDYEGYLGAEEFSEVEPDIFGFILDSTDTIPSIMNVVNAAIRLRYDVIMIDINATSTEVIDYLLDYFEKTGSYFDMESYEDRLCFGRK